MLCQLHLHLTFYMFPIQGLRKVGRGSGHPRKHWAAELALGCVFSFWS